MNELRIALGYGARCYVCVWALLLAAGAQAQPLPAQRSLPGQKQGQQQGQQERQAQLPGQQHMTPDPSTGPQNVLSEAARTLGIHQCGPAIDVIAPRVFAGSERQDIVLDWDRNAVDGAPFFSLTGLQYVDGSTLFTLTAVPQFQSQQQPGGCTVLAERISASAMSCRELVRRQLAGYRATPLVRAVTVYTSAARARETVTLVETPPGCLMLRRQVEYARQ
jgi:hypothetical protein